MHLPASISHNPPSQSPSPHMIPSSTSHPTTSTYTNPTPYPKHLPRELPCPCIISKYFVFATEVSYCMKARSTSTVPLEAGAFQQRTGVSGYLLSVQSTVTSPASTPIAPSSKRSGDFSIGFNSSLPSITHQFFTIGASPSGLITAAPSERRVFGNFSNLHRILYKKLTL